MDFTRETEPIGCEVVDLTFLFSAMVDSGEENCSDPYTLVSSCVENQDSLHWGFVVETAV